VEQEKPSVNQPEQAAGPAQPPRIVKETVARQYANCAMIMTSPADISIYFGRYQPMTGPGGEHALAEVYETEVTMNFDQAWKLCSALVQTLRTLASARTRQPAQETAGAEGSSAPAPSPPVAVETFSDLEIELPPEFCPDTAQTARENVPRADQAPAAAI
jgi:hypothetical protein